jgi:hypothetical protein
MNKNVEKMGKYLYSRLTIHEEDCYKIAQILTDAGYMYRDDIIKEINSIKSAYEKGSSLDMGFYVAIGKVLRAIVDMKI